MATKTKEQFTVLCEGLFLNDTKPQEWRQKFPWSPSVGFHYRKLDDNGEPDQGDAEKKYLKHMWLFQAMGGNNAKGRVFRLEAEHGMLPAKDGQPEKPYISIMPLAEVFTDGTARFLEAPKDGKVSVPSTPPPKPGAPPPAKPAAPSKPATTNGQQPKAPEKPKDPPKPRPKPSEKFMAGCFVAQSDQFWRLQEGFNEDAIVLSQANNMALETAKHMCGWGNNARLGEHPGAEAPEGFLHTDGQFQQEFEKWATWFKAYISQRRWESIRERFFCLLANCLTSEHVIALVEQAWAKLPKSHWDIVRERAHARISEINVKAPMDQDTLPTSTPEAPDEDFFAPDEPEPPMPPATAVAPESPAPKAPDLGLIDYTMRSLEKMAVSGNLEKVEEFWATTSPELKAVAQVAEAYAAAKTRAEIPF